MKKHIFVLILTTFFLLTGRHQIYAKITAAPLRNVQKVVLDYGFNGEFCEVDSSVVGTDKLFTLFFGNAPDDYYSSLYEKAACLEGVPTQEFLLGNVTLNYQQGYNWDESFIIVEGKMYRAGGRFFSYYQDKAKGTSYTSIDKQTISGLEAIGTNYLFASEYDKDASVGARLENSGYVSHYNPEGKLDWILLAYKNRVFKLTNIIKEQSNIVLLDNTPPNLSSTPSLSASPSATPDTTTDWQTYYGDSFSFKYPSKYRVESTDLKNVTIEGMVTISMTKITSISALEKCEDRGQQLPNQSPKSSACYILTSKGYYKYPIPIAKLDGRPAIDIGMVYEGTDRSERIIQTTESPKIEIHKSNGAGYDEEFESNFDQILSTFKFIDISATPSATLPPVQLSPTPNCLPRPACLDATPRCMMAEPANGWCP